MKRNAKKLSRATLVVTVLAVNLSALDAQALQSSSSDKPPATATPVTAPSSAIPTSSPSTTPAPTTRASSGAAKQQTSQTKNAGRVWVDTETGVYLKQGTRWYGKAKQGKYMLESDAIKAGYKPAK